MGDIKKEEKKKSKQKEYMLFGYPGVTIGLQRIGKWEIIEEELYKQFPKHIKLRFWEVGIEIRKSLFSTIPHHLKSKFKEK